jgi:hypothetical protein
MFGHTFAVHAWVLQKVKDSNKVLFAKDRNVFSGAKDFFRMLVNDSNEMVIELTKDTDGSVKDSATSTATLAAIDTWYYLVYSLAITADGKSTDVALFLGNSATGTKTLTDIFVIDDAGYKTFIGTERSATSTYANQWNGYVYDFHIYAKVHDPATDTTHHTSGCTGTNCLTYNVNEYKDPDGNKATCSDTSCDTIGCVQPGKCDDKACPTEYPFCHLCFDKECLGCDTYALCNSDKCTASTKAVFATPNCSCVAKWGRPAGNNEVCKECHDGCETCTVGAQDDFSDCTACPDSGYNDISGASLNFKYCVNYCPTGYKVADCTLEAGKEMALSYAFNVPALTFANSGHAGTLDITSTVDAPAGNPAKNRGLYFNGSNDGFVEIPGLLLSHTFSVHAWVKIATLGDLTLLSKDRADFDPATDAQHLRLSINASGELVS